MRSNTKLIALLAGISAALAVLAAAPANATDDIRAEALAAVRAYFEERINLQEVQTVVERYYAARNNNPPHSPQPRGLGTSGTTTPAASRASVNSGGHSLTVYLSEKNLKGSLNISDWSYTVDGTSQGSPSAGSFDATEGKITFDLSPAITRTQAVTVSYVQGTVFIQDQDDNKLASFGGLAAANNVWTSLACTKGPGPDPWNPEGPCGTGPSDQPGNYKPISLHSESDLHNPAGPDSVTLTCSQNSCNTSWSTVAGASNWRVYFWAILEQDDQSSATCTDDRHRAGYIYPSWDTLSHSFSLPSANSLPNGCQVAKYRVTVVTVDFNASESAAAFSPKVAP